MLAAGLRALAAALDGSFTEAVEVLAGIAGRVVVTGMGKSGHVARKVAATLASTGTPALFVHPAEASHGDLGMVVAGTRCSRCPIRARPPSLPIWSRIRGVSGCRWSRSPPARLGAGRGGGRRAALPPAAEACPMGLAPTTSTTMQMALGDALAVALLTRRGFTASEFRQFHPGGRLGARLRRVRELMHGGDAVPLAAPGTPMHARPDPMTEKRFGCIGVTERKRAPGRHRDRRRPARAMGPICSRAGWARS